ncbi:MAG TPA: 4Fe-4S dicluster domain-containing protein [Candidatus Saccharimonadales bacterium]|nr:4Fe-4S dicluster domain-containing protein [Candidatus Saccharimonadales bacterium]
MWLSILVRNLLKGPSTEPFPFAEATTPSKYRGRVEFDASRCSGCQTCQYVCAAGAIHFDETAEGMRFTLWHNSCVFCGMCEQNCMSHAIHLSNDWHLAHPQEQKYQLVEQGTVPYQACRECGQRMLPAPLPLMQKAFRGDSPQIQALRQLCPICRQSVSAGGKR